LDDSEEVLFRQVHPAFLEDGHISSSPFSPSNKDRGKLSVDRSALTTAEASFRRFTGNGYQSAFVVGVSVGEFGAERLPCYPDPIEATASQQANPAHAYADYSGTTTNESKRIGKRLRNKALDRGILFLPS